MTEEIKTIRELLPKDEVLLQLAEEANELAEAAFERKKRMKLSVTYDNRNLNFIEEIADVKLCAEVFSDDFKSIKFTTEVSYSGFELTDILILNCNRLAKAAIKLRRVLNPNASPTPVTQEEAERNLAEAIVNVKSCIDAIGNYWDKNIVKGICKDKANRWIKRMSK